MSAMVLRVCYAMSAIVLRFCFAMSGTEVGYAATRALEVEGREVEAVSYTHLRAHETEADL
eukprot:3550944-Rhodomonas_salina.3